MNGRTLLEYLVGLALVLVVGSLLLGQLLGQPVLLGFVETGSMEPTLHPNDGFVAVPMVVAGPVETGDVVVYDAEELHGGGLTTHRVVGRTEEGFITKGDANPVTDQEGAEPPVSRDQVVAKALQVGGQVVVLPNLGLLVTGVSGVLSGIQRQLAVTLGTRSVLGTQGIAYILFAIGVASYALSTVLASGRRRQRRRERSDGVLDTRLVIVAFMLFLVALNTASMVVPAGSQTVEIVSSESNAPGAKVIPTNESENLTYVVPSNGYVPAVVYLEPASEGVSVTPDRLYVTSNGEKNATVTLSAPPETGTYERTFVEHRYVALLPASTIDSLYRVHPWLPILALNALIGVGFLGVAVALVGFGPVRIDARQGNASVSTKLRRWLR